MSLNARVLDASPEEDIVARQIYSAMERCDPSADSTRRMKECLFAFAAATLFAMAAKAAPLTIYFTNCVSKDYGADCEILVSKLPDSRR